MLCLLEGSELWSLDSGHVFPIFLYPFFLFPHPIQPTSLLCWKVDTTSTSSLWRRIAPLDFIFIFLYPEILNFTIL